MKKPALVLACVVAVSACSSIREQVDYVAPVTANIAPASSYQSLMAKADGLYTSFGSQAEETRSAVERLEIFRRFA
ncbi:MAG: hypothetical protein VX501_10305, partial [Pseudomonadota bacterium]|nr:hypothetical protein [Pseudomonadota bacterium]